MTSLVSFSNLVDGAAAPVSETFESDYPSTGKAWARIPRCKASDVDEAVSAALKAFRSGPWRTMTPSARGRLLMRLADLITANSDRLAALETRDSGKLVSDMTAQVRNGTNISAASLTRSRAQGFRSIRPGCSPIRDENRGASSPRSSAGIRHFSC